MRVKDRNATFPGRKPNLWIYYEVKGREVGEPVHGDEKAAKRKMAELRRKIRNGTWLHPSDRKDESARFDAFARSVVAERAACGIGKNHLTTPNGDEISRLENHLIPEFGSLLVRDLNFTRVKQGFKAIAQKEVTGAFAGTISSGSVHNIYKLFRRIMSAAVREELISAAPERLTVKALELPPPGDKRPDGWRSDAIYEEHEIMAFAAADMPLTRKVVAITAWFTGSRARELRFVQVRAYRSTRKPLACLVVPAAKTKFRDAKRHVPVHPELKGWLDWWLAQGFELVHGRAPKPEDFLFPTPSVRRIKKGAVQSAHHEFYEGLRRELSKLGFRLRRFHDTRRTLVSALRYAEANSDDAREITHGYLVDEVMDGYTTSKWDALCKAMAKLSWRIAPPPWKQADRGNVFQLKAS